MGPRGSGVMAGWEGGDSGTGGRGEAQKDFLLEGADFSAAPAAAFSVPSGPQQLLSALSPSLSSLLSPISSFLGCFSVTSASIDLCFSPSFPFSL